MKHLLLAVIIISLASCNKEKEIKPSHPQMTYTNLSNKVVNITTPLGIDISGDGTIDVWFEILHTVDNAQSSDIHLFTIASGEHSNLLVNAQSASPIFSKGNALKISGHDGYEWKSPAHVELAKRTLIRNTGTPSWQGAWKDVQHKFLAVQVTKHGVKYNGWIEFSFDTSREKVILYRSAISNEEDKDIIAGH